MAHMAYVLAAVKLNSGWNEWQHIGGFAFSVPTWYGPADIASRARSIVDRKHEDTVAVQVLNPETKLYDQEFTMYPLKF